jgi:hypothetical protein
VLADLYVLVDGDATYSLTGLAFNYTASRLWVF